MHGAAQAHEPGTAVPRRQPGRVELVVDGSRAEIPQDRLAGAREQRPARAIVALPLADLGRCDVAAVVDVEDHERAEVGGPYCAPYAPQPVTIQPTVVQELL